MENEKVFAMPFAKVYPKSACVSCNDGFRPVSFYIEALDEDAE